MDKRNGERMRENFHRSLAWLAVGAVAVVVLELFWNAANAGNAEGEVRDAAANRADDKDEGLGLDDMAAFAFDDTPPVVGSGRVSSLFIDECFDPRGMGEVTSSFDGGVVGIVSDRDAGDLFRVCADGLDGNGWIRVESGQPLRCTFLKESGRVRWLFLDVTQVADSGVAVIVTEGGA